MWEKSPPDVSWADDRLVRACLAGDETAWAALLAKYQRLIYSIPFRYGAAPSDADDIFQAVCVDLLAELPRIRRSDSLRAWLMTVTARRSLRWKQTRAKRMESTIDDDEHPLETLLRAPDELADIEQSQHVSEAVDRLDERCRQLITRLFYDDPPKPYDELARELGLATGSIGFTRARCLEKLKANLNQILL